MCKQMVLFKKSLRETLNRLPLSFCHLRICKAKKQKEIDSPSNFYNITGTSFTYFTFFGDIFNITALTVNPNSYAFFNSLEYKGSFSKLGVKP